MFEGLGRAIAGLLWLCIIFVPLGLWKAIEIAVWLWRHVHFSP